ncbi:hypothetical protein EV363DRAFT_1262995 [Boletus edulis]|nr:hypothetical protein EV363DRAFT_1262995 [Boletus edulis]
MNTSLPQREKRDALHPSQSVTPAQKTTNRFRRRVCVEQRILAANSPAPIAMRRVGFWIGAIVSIWPSDRSNHGQEACTTASVESRRSIDGSRPTLVRSARRTDTHAAHRGGKGGDR